MADISAVEHLDFMESSDSDTPPSNGTRLLRVGGVLYQRINGAGKTPLGGASGTDWFPGVEAFIFALDSNLTETPFRDDLVSLSVQLERGSAVGSGQVSVISTEPGGVLSAKSGATANSFRVLQPKDAANADTTLNPRPVTNIRTGRWADFRRVKVKAVTATCSLDVISMTDGATGAASFGVYSGAGNVIRWAINNGGTFQDTGVAFALDTWYIVGLWNDGTNTRAYVGTTLANLALVGTPQAAATVPSATGFPSANAQNGATAANAEFYMDKWIVRTPLAP